MMDILFNVKFTESLFMLRRVIKNAQKNQSSCISERKFENLFIYVFDYLKFNIVEGLKAGIHMLRGIVQND